MISRSPLLFLLLILITGCTPSDNHQSTCCVPTNNLTTRVSNIPLGRAQYEKMYFDYRALVTEAINSTNGASLHRITDDYIAQTRNSIVAVHVSLMDSVGNWRGVLSRYDRSRPYPMAAINFGKPEPVHIYEMNGGFFSCESGMTTNRTYSDNIHIRMVIEPEFRNFLTTELPSFETTASD